MSLHKYDTELMKMDLYEILGVKLEADEVLIKKTYRKKALSCHPDRNPDNPEAAEQFIRLKRILEILLDPGARSAYDKVLKGRKAAAIRKRDANASSQKLRNDLERREHEAATVHSKISEEERLRRELKRLEEEGEKLIADELEKINREVELDLQRTSTTNYKKTETLSGVFRVKARWTMTKEGSGYTKEEIQQLFYKWGEINAVVMKQKEDKYTALIEYKEESGANMAVQFEKGLSGKPVEVSHALSPKDRKETKKQHKLSEHKIKKDVLNSSKDYESLATMNQRREAERKRLIEEMRKSDL